MGLKMEITVAPSDIALAKVYKDAENVMKPSHVEVSRLENVSRLFILLLIAFTVKLVNHLLAVDRL